jgi:hypothetical protein
MMKQMLRPGVYVRPRTSSYKEMIFSESLRSNFIWDAVLRLLLRAE